MHPIRVLFVCTGNSARSQMAEAVLNLKGGRRFQAYSAGSHPVATVNPLALEVLEESGIRLKGHLPRGLEGLDQEHWDFVITVCDQARESCPIFPGQPVIAHWGMGDPATVSGTSEVRLTAFRNALNLISRRIDRLLSLPLEKLEGQVRAQKVEAIGREVFPLVGVGRTPTGGGPPLT